MDALEQRVAKRAAAASCPTICDKKVSPHVLRHFAVMRLLAADDTTVIALWLGHDTTAAVQPVQANPLAQYYGPIVSMTASISNTTMSAWYAYKNASSTGAEVEAILGPVLGNASYMASP